jgi:uncharacterized membrane protein HdeD (DUF308 family)
VTDDRHEEPEVPPPVLERRRSGWDVALGVLLVVSGLVILAHTGLATAVSVLLLGWITLFAGIVTAATASLRRQGSWSTALSGALLVVLGVVFLRNPAATALTLTLVAASMFLLGGLTRIIAAVQQPVARPSLFISGFVSLILGLIVLTNLMSATFMLLGALVGVQALADGIALLLVGRSRVTSD